MVSPFNFARKSHLPCFEFRSVDCSCIQAFRISVSYICAPKGIADNCRYEYGIHETDESSSRGPSKISPSIFVDFYLPVSQSLAKSLVLLSSIMVGIGRLDFAGTTKELDVIKQVRRAVVHTIELLERRIQAECCDQ